MSNRPSYARQLRSGGMRLPAKIRAALADPAVADALRRLEGEMSRLRQLVGNLLDMVEDGGGQEVNERRKARERELSRGHPSVRKSKLT
jgi:hypothetical protein